MDKRVSQASGVGGSAGSTSSALWNRWIEFPGLHFFRRKAPNSIRNTGDVFHNPVQFADPEICSAACVDKEMSRKTRREFLARYENRPVRFFAVHFNDPVGRVVRSAPNWRFVAE
jgi:hypothetical protein